MLRNVGGLQSDMRGSQRNLLNGKHTHDFCNGLGGSLPNLPQLRVV